jgi:hypothetical protein
MLLGIIFLFQKIGSYLLQVQVAFNDDDCFGIGSEGSKFREAGGKAFALAGVLFLVLFFGGALLVWCFSHL